MSGAVYNHLFKKVIWDSNIYFQCGHTMSPDILEMMLDGDLEVPNSQKIDKQQKIKMIINNQKLVLGSQANITTLWLYKTPIYQDLQWTSQYLNHQYIILQLIINENQTKYCCLEKNKKRITIMYSDTFQQVRDYQALRPGTLTKRCKTSYWKPQKIQQRYLYSDFYQLVKFLFLSEENEKKYDTLNENCHHFCSNVTDFLKKHYIK